MSNRFKIILRSHAYEINILLDVQKASFPAGTPLILPMLFITFIITICFHLSTFSSQNIFAIVFLICTHLYASGIQLT